jgi:hypothetical protein
MIDRGRHRERNALRRGEKIVDRHGNFRFVLEAESESDFYYKGSFLNVHFTKDNSGNTAGFQMEQFGGSRFAKKIGQ